MEQNVPLAPLTTFRLGGTADHFLSVTETSQLSHLPRRDQWRLLGGGSNLLINDSPLPGFTIANRIHGLTVTERDGAVFVSTGAGMRWDTLVDLACSKDWQGIECLSGIPGTVGAAPVQNIGAYGQSLSDTLHEVSGMDVSSGEHRILDKTSCRFDYRTSVFQTTDFFVTSVTLKLRPDKKPTLTYQDLAGRFDNRHPSLLDVRKAVLAIRASKGALAMDGYPRKRSAGSFFKNPVVTSDIFNEMRSNLVQSDDKKWYWRRDDSTVKIAAGRLIEAAGFKRGFRDGPVGNSPHHSLSIIAYKGAKASDVVGLARRIQETVLDKYSIVLDVEPQLWGWDEYPLLRSDS